jgi:hypothetical protein
VEATWILLRVRLLKALRNPRVAPRALPQR